MDKKLACAVKFCGGCNPRYDRGKAYKAICAALSGTADFEVTKEGKHYDLLLIIRGCTQCPYLYENIDADKRVVVTSQEEADAVPEGIRQIVENF